MSWLTDSTELVSGGWLSSQHAGHGALGSVIRATTGAGAHGAGYLYNDWQAGDDSKEFRGLIVTPPSGGVFTPYEDGSFTLAGAPDGAYSFVYRLYVDGADLGTATASLTVGTVAPTTATITAAIAGAVTGAIAAAASISDAVTPTDVTVTATISGLVSGAVSAATTVEDAPALAAGKRRVKVGLSTAPTKLQRMDVQEVDDIAFEHAAELLAGESITTAAVSAELHMGVDDSPSLVLLYAAQVSGANVIQRVRGRVSGATYMLRCLATLSSGRQLVGAAILPIVKLR